MEEIRKFLLVITGLVMAMVTMILVMIYGWGLQAKSWWWIIGMNLLRQMLAQIFIIAGKDGKKVKPNITGSSSLLGNFPLKGKDD